MLNRQVTHTIKLDWQLKLIAIILAIGVLLHALLPLFQPAKAQQKWDAEVVLIEDLNQVVMQSIGENIIDLLQYQKDLMMDQTNVEYYLKEINETTELTYRIIHDSLRDSQNLPYLREIGFSLNRIEK